MPNPGSPESMRMQDMPAPAFPKGALFSMFFMIVYLMIVMTFREPVGQALDVFFSVVAFTDNPALTLILAGVIMIVLSTIVRCLLTDLVGPAMTQYKSKKFSAAYRQARLENNLNKLKKYEAMQAKMMAATQKQSSDMMMMMPATMVVLFPVYAWVWYFVEHLSNTIIWMPWGQLDLTSSIVMFPAWIIIYSLMSLPLGQVLSKFFLYIKIDKRMEMLDAGIEPPQWKPFWKRRA